MDSPEAIYDQVVKVLKYYSNPDNHDNDMIKCDRGNTAHEMLIKMHVEDERTVK